ncbi:hypothetical protein ACLOJK_032626 [Asimina triloba]
MPSILLSSSNPKLPLQWESSFQLLGLHSGKKRKRNFQSRWSVPHHISKAVADSWRKIWKSALGKTSSLPMWYNISPDWSIALGLDFLVATVNVQRVHWVSSIVLPTSDCYVLDNSSYIYDFVSSICSNSNTTQTCSLLCAGICTDWIGHAFEYDAKDSESESDLVVRFCKDVEARSQKGYVDYGRFATSNYFMAGSEHVNFVQGFFNGDLNNCEGSYDKMGRTATVHIICGNCANKQCKDRYNAGGFGCICDVTYDPTMCRAFIELAIPCVKKGLRVFEGFTVGFHPRSWELVYNGLTQLGFEKARHEFSFGTEQAYVSLYMTAISALSHLVGKPVFKVEPDKGLEVKLSVSASNKSPPTTLSPSILMVNWRCEKAHETPYEVVVSIPVEGYEPIDFTLTKLCEYRQERVSEAASGWATFGVLSCVTRVEHQKVIQKQRTVLSSIKHPGTMCLFRVVEHREPVE